MDCDNFLDWPTTRLSEAIRTGELSSETVVSACLRRITLRDAHYRAFLAVFSKEALAEARALDRERSAGQLRGPLHGMPVAVKDLADIAGHPTGFGSRCYAQGAARQDATFIRALRAAGAVIIGKTHTVEFAFGSWGTNHAMGTPVNPAGPGHLSPGGSSSGSAVAVAAGMVPLAVGSDTGGSIRIPAALCGVAGFKPSHGVTSLQGVAPLSPDLDTIGPIARDVAGLRLLSRAIATGSAPAPERGGPLRLLRLSAEDLSPLHPEILASYERELQLLSVHMGPAQVLRLPLPLTEYQRLCGNLMAHDAYVRLRHLIDDPDAALDPHVRKRIAAGRDICAGRHEAGVKTRRLDIAEFLKHFGEDDLLVLPSTPEPPRQVAQIDEAQLPMSRFTRLANYLDLAGASLPLWRANGLPAGAQFVMRRDQDCRLLAFLETVERRGIEVNVVPARRRAVG